MAAEGAECSSRPDTDTAEARTWRWVIVMVTAGALVGAAVLSLTSAGRPDRLLAWLLFVGSSVHVASTGWFFTSSDVRKHAVVDDRRRLVMLPLGLVVCCGVAGLLLPAASLSWMLLPFFVWQFHRFQKQNLGLVVLSATSAGVSGPQRFERRIVMLAGVCGIAALVADPVLLQLGIYQIHQHRDHNGARGIRRGPRRGIACSPSASRSSTPTELLRHVCHISALPASGLRLSIAVCGSRGHDDRTWTAVPDPHRDGGPWRSARSLGTPRDGITVRHCLGWGCCASVSPRASTCPMCLCSAAHSVCTWAWSAPTSSSTQGSGV